MKKIVLCTLTVMLFGGIIHAQREAKPAKSPREMARYMQQQAHRTNPDYVCYIPGSYDGSTNDSHNEHFLVFDGPDGSLMAVWTQNHFTNGRRIVFSRSDDKGVSWTVPKHLAGPRNENDKVYQAVWGFPMVSHSGRIYVLWNQNQGMTGWLLMHTGTMSGIYSDDYGKTWSEPQDIPMPRSIYDDPEGIVPADWIVWQNPERLANGKYIVGYSHWVHPSVAFFNRTDRPPPLQPGGSMTFPWWESVVKFMVFENIDDNPEPKDLDISYHAWNDQALRVPHFIEPRLSVAQEPSIVRLPDDRLFSTMRTSSGYIWYSVSDDFGETWCNPRPLLRKDHGSPILQPVSCCPIYQLADGRYVLLHHNNRGDMSDPGNIAWPRTPAYIALGEFRPDADQPVWFSESKVFIDNGSRTPAGEIAGRGADAATYTSFTTSKGKNILWYPDAKCWLLGKEVTEEFLRDLVVP